MSRAYSDVEIKAAIRLYLEKTRPWRDRALAFLRYMKDHEGSTVESCLEWIATTWPDETNPERILDAADSLPQSEIEMLMFALLETRDEVSPLDLQNATRKALAFISA